MTDKENKAEKKAVPQKALRIHAKPKTGFRRAGFEFSGDRPREFLLSELSAAQIQALRAEPNLVVVEIDV